MRFSQSRITYCHILNLQKFERNIHVLVVQLPGLKLFVLRTKFNFFMPIVVDDFTFLLLL
jgi:hypothetical protein